MGALALWLALQLDPIEEARRLAQRGELGEAMRILTEARESATSPELLAFLAQLQTAHDQIPQAAETLSAALALAPQQARLRATLGAMYFRLGQLDAAEEELRRALAQDGSIAAAHYYLAAVHKMAGRMDLAQPSVERALELLPEDTRFDPNDFGPRTNALFLLAEVHFARDRSAPAEERLRDVLRAEPTHVEGRYLLAQLFFATERRKQGEDELALFREVKAAQQHLDLALNLSRHAREPGRALEELALALEAYPDHPRALFHLGVELIRAGQRREAQARLERLLELRPDAASMVNGILSQLGR